MKNSPRKTKMLNHLNNSKIPIIRQYVDEDGIINVVVDIKYWDDEWNDSDFNF